MEMTLNMGTFEVLDQQETFSVNGGAHDSYNPMGVVFDEAIRHLYEGVKYLCTPDNLREIGSEIRTACGYLVRAVLTPTTMHLVS